MATTTVGLFDFIDPPSPDHLEVCIDESLRHIDFPWYRIIPGLRSKGRSRVQVLFQPIDPSLLGSYSNSQCAITMNSIYPLSGMPFTFAHEVGHMVDDLTLANTAAGLAQREKIRQFWVPLSATNPDGRHTSPHQCQTWKNSSDDYLWRHFEAYAEAFVAAFSPVVWGARSPYSRFVHWPVDYTNVATQPPIVRYDKIRQLTLEHTIMAFTDVPPTHTHAEGINWAAGQGIISGYPDGTFRPNDPVSRGAFCTMLKRYDDLQPDG